MIVREKEEDVWASNLLSLPPMISVHVLQPFTKDKKKLVRIKNE